ncbi:choice-of-anchor M domain-containing protein [Trueperella pyogenes]|uniref:choice-of-anchor M domain-containing protein n=1 Tax=Trueperella pyogenes TaxID=1661 RepID=UPI00325076D2
MKEFLSRSAKVAAAAMTASLVAFAPLTASAAPDRFELSGGHVDAFYVYNLPEETKIVGSADIDDDESEDYEDSVKYETKLHLDVKEDVTQIGTLRNPNEVRFKTFGKSFTCFDENAKEQFGNAIPGVTGAYMSDSHSSTVLNPGYSKHLAWPDPEKPDDRDEDYKGGDVTLKFSNVRGPEGGALIPYEMRYDFKTGTSKVGPELKDNQYAIKDGSVWELTSSHHHAKWLATKSGTYSFDVTATAEYNGQEFTSETKTYEWVVEKSDLEGTCGGTKQGKPDVTPDKPEKPDTDADDPEDSDEPEDEESEGPADEESEDPEDEDAEDPEGEDSGNQETPAPGKSKNPDSDKNPTDRGDKADKDKPSVDPKGTVILDRGHADIFNVVAKNGELELNMKEDVTALGTIRKPEEVVIKVTEAMRENVSANIHPNIITSGYLLPDPQKTGKEWPGGSLWPGWETLGVRPDFSHIDIQFENVSGPGRVQLFTFKNLGQLTPLLADGSIDLKSGSTIPVPDPTHVHTNWLFEKPGVYTMKVKASGKNKAGELVTSNTATYTWHVGDFKPGKKDDGSADNTTPGSTDKDKAGSDTGKDKAVTPINIADSTKVRITAPKEIAVEKVDADHPLGYEQLAAAGFKVEALKAQAEKEKHASSDKGSAVSATQLKFGVDYTVSFGDPNRAGDNKIIVAGLGNYTGSVELPIKVVLESASEQGTPSTGGQPTGTPDAVVPATGTPNAVVPTTGNPATTRLSHTGASTELLTSLAALLLAGGAIFAVYRKKA